MGILWVRETAEQHTAKISAEGKAERTKSFLALVDNSFDTVETVLRDVAIPAIWDTYIGVQTIQVSEVSATQHKDFPFLWDIVVTFSNRAAEKKDQKSDGKDDGSDHGQSPDDDIPVFEYDAAPYLVPMTIDAAGKKVTNSAKDGFNPPLQTPLYETIIRVHRNMEEATYNNLSTQFTNARGAVNNGPIKIGNVQCDTQTAKLTSLHAKRSIKNGKIYYEITAEVRIRPDWFIRILDVGSNFIDPNDNKKKPIEIKGVRVKLWGLQGGNISDTPDTLVFDPNPKADFSAIKIFKQ